MNQLLIIMLGRTKKRLLSIGRDDLAGNQAIGAKARDCLEVPAFEVEVSILYERRIHFSAGECVEALEHVLVAVRLARRCRKTGIEQLRWLRVAHCELARALNVAAGTVSRRAYETEVILPTHRRNHVFWREVRLTICIRCANQHQRGDIKEVVPYRAVRTDLDEIRSATFYTHFITCHKREFPSHFQSNPSDSQCI